MSDMKEKFAVGDVVRWTDARSRGDVGTITDRTRRGAYRPGPVRRRGHWYWLVQWDGGACRWCTQLEVA
jgi:hypothetical protein